MGYRQKSVGSNYSIEFVDSHNSIVYKHTGWPPANGAPVDLIQYLEESSVPLNQELMRQVDLVVATGGAVMAKVSRILVRQAHAPSAGGHFHNGMPSTVTLGCGTWGGNITNENIHWRYFINVTWFRSRCRW